MAGIHVRFEITPEKFLEDLTEAAWKAAAKRGPRDPSGKLRASLKRALKKVLRRDMLESKQCGSRIIGICAHAERHEPWAKAFLFFLAGLLPFLVAGCAGNASKGQVYGTQYGSPESKLGAELPKDDKLFSGDAVTKLPEVKPVPAVTVHNVRLDVNHKVVEVFDNVKMGLWAFGDDIPGSTIHIRQGDKVVFTLTNRSTEQASFTLPMPHSIDFHAAMVSPQDKYRTIDPGQTLTFEWTANYPGVFMYHCATTMVLQHLAKGMYGMTIVEPAGGYPTKVDREYALVQSEFYPKKDPDADGTYDTDMEAVERKQPTYVTFNGRFTRHINEPLQAKTGERVRLYVLNAGPNDTSSFHVIGTIFDRVWIDGNPANEMRGLQTILLGASSGAIVEFVIPEKGQYVFVDHEFSDAHHGAMGVIDASQ